MISIKEISLKEIEDKWRKKWLNEKIFEADPNEREKFFITFPFPYLDGPLHLGHTFTLTRLDIIARFKRMQGFNVLFPFAFHATGEPIVGATERLKKGDPVQKKVLSDAGVPESEIEKFKDPKYIVRYWQRRIINDVNLLGISVDWRRSFTTIDPIFNRFIEWQYRFLKRNGYVAQGTHPVIWCPSCESPTGDHDRLKGEGESPLEYVLFKFKLSSGEILPMATLRPETIYGVTNVWINPEAEYVKAKVNNEIWIISRACAQKLKDQLYSVEIIERVEPKELIGKRCINPVLKNEVLILPAGFVDPGNATGLVMSVPSHAPYDWIGLKDLVKDEETLKKFDIPSKEVKEIKPISLIRVPGFGEHPAIEICEKLGIESQKDVEKLDEATRILYKKEFHLGVLKDNCGEYAGFRVSQVKQDLIKDLEGLGYIAKMFEPSGEVICRCGTECHVKILENQWFLRFSDERWKEKARICLRRMKIFPEEARKNFEYTIEWLQDKACARKTGLGTKLPWDKEWIVETLSDSVIYMAFYTIAKYLNSEKIEPDQLKDEVFDFVFLGKGNDKEIAEKTGISRELLQRMRREFEYWYGFDLRGSAKELIPNHLTFTIFHHVAIWENEKYWPKAFTVNGMLKIEGKKMSKSKGNFILLKDAVEKYGADVVRVSLMDSAEGLNDADWHEASALAWKKKLINFFNLVEENYDKGKEIEDRSIDIWLISRFQQHIKKMTEHLEKVENRSALTCFHFMFNDFLWYLKRVEEKNRKVVDYALEVMTKVLSLYTPYICEEIWERMGKNGFICFSEWPSFDEKKIDEKVMKQEEAFMKACEDIKEVIKLSGKNEKLYLYVVNDEELKYYKEASEFLKKEFGFKEIHVFKVSDPKKYDPEDKAKRAKFGKPGIYVE